VSRINEAGQLVQQLRSKAPAAVGSILTSWSDLGLLGMCGHAALICLLLF
jgi:hypothetical protein